MLIVGLDIGASTTKGVIFEDSRLVHHLSVPTSDIEISAASVIKRLLAEIKDRDTIDLVAVSGGGSRKIGDTLLGLPVKRVNEIRAIGLGGLTLTGKREGLVVSIGTGTAMVSAHEGGRQVNHVGGTGVGGGTVMGLSKRLLGVENFTVLEDMASKGDTGKVDLTVDDIVGGPIGIVPDEATASNFGKLKSEAAENDVAAGIFNMVSQVVGVLAAMAAKAYDLEENVILVGGLARSRMVSETVRKTAELFGVKVCVPENCEYCTAVGAAEHGSFC
ncbi:MAG: FGGY-family carbohydrate kinase [Candidatus Bathyarchaeota archaeon]|nr:FGGY-family carbohydrate kinase [Candidatus Bathyarchaeota archaeon]